MSGSPPDAEAPGVAADGRPAKNKRPKRKRRARKKKAASKRPLFARAYPESKDLDTLLDALGAGNHALVRRRTAELIEQTEDEALRAAALDLRRRISPDPTSIYLWALGVALALLLYGYYLVQSHG